ncbi:MAG: phosphotransacetylase family protein [Geminocystis sp.]|nr:phosphotransacetylase family protein [Geminocystis sp.]HIK38540.1 phosphotransacetylase family protein [Geminocystis sp. M7585_C2015_104]MCS7147371.1 phosphotransacetylase family protein [Geminocystis sp.]MCX8079047.1 phosphotransacetylase family protein [Geminocystis sp.]MDW8116370.1 phosphotransacetylase family protein [Geminocystis sp.]
MTGNKRTLLVASTEAYTGKTATIIGIAKQLQQRGIKLAYGKPIGTCFQENDRLEDEQDLQFISQLLSLGGNSLKPPLLLLDEKTIISSLGKENQYRLQLQQYCDSLEGDLILLEGANNLFQGQLFNLSVPEMAHALPAQVLIVVRYNLNTNVDQILLAKQLLQDKLIGVLINSVPPEAVEIMEDKLKPFYHSRGIEVLACLPKNRLLQSVSVRELVRQLRARVLCCEHRLDLMVESLTVGAMNVNAALEYFRRGRNMAVITGSDRTDLQLAALESSTTCLILTGHVPPQPLILSRAEDLEVPILMVDCDTLTTVEIVNRAFGKVRLHEPVKVECMQQLIQEHFHIETLMEKLNL